MLSPEKPIEKNQSPPKPPAGGAAENRPPEFGGPKGPEPTRDGEWDQGGRCTDF
jgi:hypothetical protein